jgi:hypothetical protein
MYLQTKIFKNEATVKSAYAWSKRLAKIHGFLSKGFRLENKGDCRD